ncbi:MAG: type II toxin-antitoxin system RelE/ParE family toxin [Rubrivivax sp.]|nr:type II toxin-antitoxin system RelE/ParE family toxin [Rubrivivax sp.]
MKVRFLPAAEIEFIKELAYYSKTRPGSAAKFEASVEAAAHMAMRHPQGGAPSYKETRTFRVKGFPFSLVYRASVHEVLVIAIAPHSKEPNYWASRVDA